MAQTHEKANKQEVNMVNKLHLLVDASTQTYEMTEEVEEEEESKQETS